MPKFNIEAEFSLYSEFSPEFSSYVFDGAEDIEDVEDNSYFSDGSVEVSGGSLTFSLDAEDESDAERKAEGVVYDDMEVEDSNGFTWSVTNVSFSVEAVEMSTDEAIAVLTAWLGSLSPVDESVIPTEIREALIVVLESLRSRA